MANKAGHDANHVFLSQSLWALLFSPSVLGAFLIADTKYVAEVM